jgi:hypothetical protein
MPVFESNIQPLSSGWTTEVRFCPEMEAAGSAEMLKFVYKRTRLLILEGKSLSFRFNIFYGGENLYFLLRLSLS